MSYREIKAEKQRYWYVVEALILLFAAIYGIAFLFFGVQIALYAFIVFGIISIASALIMFSQKHFLTLLVNSVFALLVILHYIYQYMY